MTISFYFHLIADLLIKTKASSSQACLMLLLFCTYRFVRTWREWTAVGETVVTLGLSEVEQLFSWTFLFACGRMLSSRENPGRAIEFRLSLECQDLHPRSALAIQNVHEWREGKKEEKKKKQNKRKKISVIPVISPEGTRAETQARPCSLISHCIC